jgi:hypothetical protein
MPFEACFLTVWCSDPPLTELLAGLYQAPSRLLYGIPPVSQSLRWSFHLVLSSAVPSNSSPKVCVQVEPGALMSSTKGEVAGGVVVVGGGVVVTGGVVVVGAVGAIGVVGFLTRPLETLAGTTRAKMRARVVCAPRRGRTIAFTWKL